MEVGGQFHASESYSRGMSSPVPIAKEAGWDPEPDLMW
jgi:hypothetical protein